MKWTIIGIGVILLVAVLVLRVYVETVGPLPIESFQDTGAAAASMPAVPASDSSILVTSATPTSTSAINPESLLAVHTEMVKLTQSIEAAKTKSMEVLKPNLTEPLTKTLEDEMATTLKPYTIGTPEFTTLQESIKSVNTKPESEKKALQLKLFLDYSKIQILYSILVTFVTKHMLNPSPMSPDQTKQALETLIGELANVKVTMGLSAATAAPPVPSAAMMAAVTAAPAPPPATKEGFASIGNPYNSPSPSLTQAYKFRLGTQELVNSVFRTV